jgi:Na+/H+ antiporter NhaD/arsenite permease-like protein
VNMILAAAILVGVYLLIAFDVVHRTVAALLGAASVLVITYILGTVNSTFVILPFDKAVSYIDFNVIFLLMSMMVLVTITARTGVFQWLAVQAYRRAGGSTWTLAVLFMIATAILSAFLDNVTTMLLMVPITLEIALILRLNAAALLLPEVFASNIGGAATLIGDPPNLLIGSYAGLNFGDFLVFMAPAAAVALVGLVAMTRLQYHGQYTRQSRDEARALLHRLEREYVIKDPVTLRRALIVSGGVVLFFLLASRFGMPASVPALFGMAVLLVWTKADVVQELEAVEWPSLLFFIALFIVIGAAIETGLIDVIAQAVARLAGDSLAVAIVLVIWITAFASMLVDNIPITATMLPVVAYLTQTIPGATDNSLYWALAFGACFGGNGTIVGASANIITTGLAERAGFAVTFGQFARKGLPVAIMSLLIATVWVLFVAWVT